jgi:hypothetical protein
MDNAGHITIASVPCRLHWSGETFGQPKRNWKAQEMYLVMGNYEDVMLIIKLKVAGKKM